jgi:hypothetical protein
MLYMLGVLHNSYIMLYLEAAVHWKIVRAPGLVLKGISSKELARLTSTAARIYKKCLSDGESKYCIPCSTYLCLVLQLPMEPLQ